MPWSCKLLEIVGVKFFPLPKVEGSHIVGETRSIDASGKDHAFRQMPIGSMFYLPKDADMDEWPWYLAEKERLSDYYHQHNSHRQPLFVVLPNHTLFLIDGKCFTNGRSYGGWTITGDTPNITVSPSINIGGGYHGFLTNGVIGEDVEGRKF